MRIEARAVAILAVCSWACATAGPPRPVDLSTVRDAVVRAREAGAAERAPAPLERAESHLKEAEAASAQTQGDPRLHAQQAETLAQLAASEARCALEMARLGVTPAPTPAAPEAVASAARAASTLKKTEDERRRLEERVVFLERELEFTENEVIRSKARLKGMETKAEASSAIAEARILAGRLARDRSHAATLARCNELIQRAESLLQQENFGAAAFFALKAQDAAGRTEDGSPRTTSEAAVEQPPPRQDYQVKAASANIRRGPGTGEPIVATAPRGSRLVASAMRGEWLKVRFGSASGWVHSSLVE